MISDLQFSINIKQTTLKLQQNLTDIRTLHCLEPNFEIGGNACYNFLYWFAQLDKSTGKIVDFHCGALLAQQVVVLFLQHVILLFGKSQICSRSLNFELMSLDQQLFLLQLLITVLLELLQPQSTLLFRRLELAPVLVNFVFE